MGFQFRFPTQALRDRFGNLRLFLSRRIVEDRPGLVLRVQGDGYALDTMRWGFPKITDAAGNIEKGAIWRANARYTELALGTDHAEPPISGGSASPQDTALVFIGCSDIRSPFGHDRVGDAV